MKKVYFAGSITGGRQDADVYAQIIDKLKEHFIVLTEHIGSKDLTEMGETNRTDEEIYSTDVRLIRECDFVFAEVTQVSMGVGYEIGFAEAHKKPIYCFVNGNKNKRLSAMLLGNSYLKIFTYYDINEVFAKINDLNEGKLWKL